MARRHLQRISPKKGTDPFLLRGLRKNESVSHRCGALAEPVAHGFIEALLVVLLFIIFSAICFAEEDAASVDKRTLWTTSRVVGSPEPPPPYTVERVFPQLTFKGPVHLILGPDRQRYFLTGYTGKIVSFAADEEAEETAPFLELKMNLHSLAFHPRFEENRYVYVFGNTAPQVGANQKQYNQVLRFEVTREDPPRVDLQSKQVILEYHSNGHNGGEAKFGPDGYLYITGGDGTSDSDGWNTGQNVSDLPASMLRIDVDHADEGRAYSIPDVNPFVDIESARDEIYAYGFRNPWRFNFDFETGNLYVGDVGQDLWEMIQLVRPGDNFGWSVKEGTSDFHPLKARGPTPIVPPLVEHHHTESRSITGGYVYRGSRLPKLNGAYIYGDYETGKIWGLRHEGNEITWHEELADVSLKTSSFAEGLDGEFLLLDYQSGEIYELVPAPEAKDHPPFPRRLSETGIFSSTEELTPAEGLIPYTVNAPQWNDGAEVQRYIGLPGDSQITFSKSGVWIFPERAVLVKTIILPSAGDGTNARRVETQILTLQAGQWAGYSYIWNQEQTDAELAPPEGEQLALTIPDPAAEGDQREQPWRVVSRSECMVCHSRAAGFALGPHTGQMNRDYPFSSEGDNQLRAIEKLGAFAEPLPESFDELPQLANPYDEQAELSARARAYLHANCSHCHVGAGGGNAKIVLTAQTALEKMELLGGRPLHADFGIAGAMLVAPGDADRSVLYHRIARRGNGQMPPLATHRVDEAAAKLIHDWIKEIEVPKTAQAGVDRSIAEVQGASGALPRWRVAGPLEARPGEDILSRLAVAPAEDKIYDWQRAIGQGTECRVALANTKKKTVDESYWLARTDAIMPEQSEIQLFVEGVGVESVWLNGSRLSSATGASSVFETTLYQGRNRLLVEIYSPGEAAPSFHVSFRRKSSNETHERFTLAALSESGDHERGRQLFLDSKKTQCAKCHRVGEEGGEVGPPLTDVGVRLSMARIIESVLEPSRTVAPNYRVVSLELLSGRVVNGILVSETSDAVTIKDERAEDLVFSKSEIAVMQIQPLSLMPGGLEKAISEEEFVDLIAYLSGLTSLESAAKQREISE